MNKIGDNTTETAASDPAVRFVEAARLTETVRDVFLRANTVLPNDVRCMLEHAAQRETAPRAAEIFTLLGENARIAAETGVPICQDTGMAVVFLEIGAQVVVTGQTPDEAVHAGVRAAYAEGYFRKSIVADPLRRVNTEDNTPAVIHTRIVPGNRIAVTAAPKGFGSENMSALRMFSPTADRAEIIGFVRDTVAAAGGKPCPPVVVGVGIGGTMEYAALYAKRALLREVGTPHTDPLYAALERDMYTAINETGIGPQGLGGQTTALGVAVEPYATHIAGLPVAVNIGCHANRHASAVI